MEDYYVILIVIGVILLFSFSVKSSKKKKSYDEIGNIKKTDTEEKLPYIKSECLLTKRELEFYKSLEPIAGKHNLSVAMKVRLADVVYLDKNRKDYMTWFNKIRSKHIDFALYDPETVEPLIFIELNDSTHSQKNRQIRDAFVNNIMNQVGLTLVTINDLNAAPLDRIISKKFEESQNSGQAKDADVIKPDTDLHNCPFCGGELVERTRKSDGGKFFGCKGYPKCRYTTQELKTLEKAKK